MEDTASLVAADAPRTLPEPSGSRPSSTPGSPGRPALLVVLVVTLLSVVRAFGPMTFNIDIWRQTDTATIARNFALHGMNPLLPQIDWGGAGPGYVEAEFQFMPYLAACVYKVLGEHVAIGRLISLGFMLIGTAAFWGLARRLLPLAAARWALVAFVVSPVFMRYGTAFMPEATVLAFYLLALYAFARWMREDRALWLGCAATATALAALAKPTALNIGVVFLVWLVVDGRDRLRRPSLYLAGLAALVPVGLWLWHGHQLYLTYGNTFGVISGGDDKFGNPSYWISPMFYLGTGWIEFVWVFGVFAALPAVVGAVRAAKDRGPAVLLGGVVAIIVYYFAIARYSESGAGTQYHVFSSPYAAMFAGLGLDRMVRLLRGWRPPLLRSLAMAAAVVLMFTVSAGIFVSSMRDHSGVFGVCGAQLRSLSAPTDLAVISSTSASVDGGVANNWQEPDIFYFADRRGWSLAADQHLPGFLDADRRAGAAYFVVYDASMVPTGSPLAGWLATQATQVRSSATDGCDIWDLRRPTG